MKRFIPTVLVLICMISSMSVNAQVAYDSVNVVTAGTLGTLLGSKKFTVTNLKISGKLNGTDIKYLREIMAGLNNSDGTTTYGMLSSLDLYNSKIVTGGIGYIEIYKNGLVSVYTKTDIIGEQMFENCNNLTSMVLPKDVKTIERSAFEGCTNLTSINLTNISKIGSNAFSDCYKIQSILIPSGLSSIESGTFYACLSITSITIPSNIKSIGSSAFSSCIGLKVLNIENGLSTIESSAFNGCNRLSVINCKCKTPPAVDYYGAGLALNSKCKLYIPIGTFYAYWLSLGWGDIPTILEYSESDLLKLTIKQAENAQLTQVVAKGDSLSLIFEPINGWKVNTISFNGIDETDKLNASNQYITPEITVNSTISVSYISTSIVVPQQNQSNIKVYSNDGTIQLKGVEQGERIDVFNLSGKLVKSVDSFGSETAIEAEKDQIYLIKVAGNTFKVLN